MKYPVFILYLLVGSVHSAGAQNIYGFVTNHFVSFNPYTDEADTLIVFEGNPYINLGFRTTIDRYNGRYFFGGAIPGIEGKFHIIDLNTLEISSFPVYPENIEYDYIRDKIVYEKNGAFYSLDLASMQVTNLGEIENGNSVKFGQIRTYVAQTKQYVYADFPGFDDDYLYYLVVDATTGTLVCQEKVEYFNGNQASAKGLVTNHHTGHIIGHHAGTFGFLDPCESHMTRLSDIEGYYSHKNTQLSVFNHTDYTYIVPFLTSGTGYRNFYAIVDPYHDQVLAIKPHPFDGRMNQHQIYDKPFATLWMIGDTLFVPRGVHYSWFKDGQLIGETIGTENFWVPTSSGMYTCEVVFKEYTSMSQDMQVTLTRLDNIAQADGVQIYPNPTRGEITIDLNDDINRLIISDMTGKMIQQMSVDTEMGNQVKMETNHLAPGAYIVTLYGKNRLYTQRIIKL